MRVNKLMCVCVYVCVSVCICALMCNTPLCACVFMSQCVCSFSSCSAWPGQRMLQGHVLCSGERQPVCAVVVDQLGDTGEHAATLIQGEAQTLCTLSLGHNDVHAVLTGSSDTKHTHTYFQKENVKGKRHSLQRIHLHHMMNHVNMT